MKEEVDARTGEIQMKKKRGMLPLSGLCGGNHPGSHGTTTRVSLRPKGHVLRDHHSGHVQSVGEEGRPSLKKEWGDSPESAHTQANTSLGGGYDTQIKRNDRKGLFWTKHVRSDRTGRSKSPQGEATAKKKLPSRKGYCRSHKGKKKRARSKRRDWIQRGDAIAHVGTKSPYQKKES